MVQVQEEEDDTEEIRSRTPSLPSKVEESLSHRTLHTSE